MVLLLKAGNKFQCVWYRAFISRHSYIFYRLYLEIKNEKSEYMSVCLKYLFVIPAIAQLKHLELLYLIP